MRNKIIYFIALFLLCIKTQGQPITKESKPFIGTQIFIEPGQSEVQLNNYFNLMKNNNIEACRIRMFGLYMKNKDGQWDFSLFDRAFRLAEKYNIKVYATLFPETDFSDIGGFKFPHTEHHLQEISEYIKHVVTHFSSYSSLTAWVLMNEPGTIDIPLHEPFTQNKYKQWKQQQEFKQYNAKGYPIINFEQDQFLLAYQSWYLEWLANQVLQYDARHELHTNPHNIFKLSRIYNFPAWRKFLDTFGASAHASWHFNDFTRNHYPIAMSANAELIRAGAGEKQWLMTELQGGNNIYSGAVPLCPTKEEITQWLWINLASEAKGAFFWSLNTRSTGVEAGEWGMIDFDGKPTDRLEAASNIAQFINQHKEEMSNISVWESGISVLYTRTSLWTETLQNQGKTGYANRGNIVMQSSIAYFEALAEMGLQANFSEINEFDFSQKCYEGKVIILSNQISLSSKDICNLERFVSKGGTLLVDGLTSLYDEQAHCTVVSGFISEKLFGARPLEFKMISENFNSGIDSIPGYLWQGKIVLNSAKSITNNDKEIIASVNRLGKGKVIWVPTSIGLGSRLAGDYQHLTSWIVKYLPKDLLSSIPHFNTYENEMFMKSFKSNKNLYSLIINKTRNTKVIHISGIKKRTGYIWFSDKNVAIKNDYITIPAEGTLIIKWI